MQVDKLDEASDAVDKGLALAKENKDLLLLKGDIDKAKEQRKKNKEEAALKALKTRRINLLFEKCLELKQFNMGKTFLHPLQQGCVDV